MKTTLSSAFLVTVLAAATAGCGSAPGPTPRVTVSPAPASPGESPAPVAAPWLAVDVAHPSEVTTAPSLPSGYFCDPCHSAADDDFLGTTAYRGGVIAVGVQQPPAQAIAFSSADGAHWAPLPGFSGVLGSTAIAAATSGTRTVIVGFDHTGATAWASDGGQWKQAPSQSDLLVPYVAGAMTAVTTFDGGFIAGGYRDDPLHDAKSAAAWRSTDGLTWRADSSAGAFAGGRIWGIAARAGTVVAVGTMGDPNYGPAGAWQWTKADGWRRATFTPDANGAMRAVTATGSGFVAVGLNGTDNGARVWTSTDGLTWTAVPDQPAFHYYAFPVRMQSIVDGPSGLVAGGWRSDVGKGSAVTWTSSDGLTWQGPTWEPAFSGGEVSGLVVDARSVIAVGRTGYPDNNQAAVWVSPSP